MKLIKAIALSVTVSAISATSASAYSAKVRNACAGDYQNFCSQYIPESAQARRCFESNRKSLSKYCISALVKAGEVPRKYLRR